ncbi:condensation domain-containing protein, partial [Streptomyces sp. URMC 126]
LQNPPRLDFELPGASLRAVPLPRHSTRFDLEFHLWEEPETGALRGAVVHSTDLFDTATAERMIGQLRRLLTEAVRDPERPVAE